VAGVELAHPGVEFFKEFAVRTARPAGDVLRDLLEAGFLAGPVVRDSDGEVLLISVTERRSREEIDAFVKAVEQAVRVDDAVGARP